MSDPASALHAFQSKVEHLRLDRARGPVKPYKPILLATVLVLIGKAKIRSRTVYLDGALKSAFEQLFRQLQPSWRKLPDIRLPFRHLENDGIWRLVPRDSAEARLEAARALGSKARDVLKHVACAEFDEEVFVALSEDPSALMETIAILVAAFPDAFPGPKSAEVEILFRDQAARPERSIEDLSERAIEEYFEANWPATTFGRMGIDLSQATTTGLPGRQVLTPVSAIDLLGFEPGAKRWWVFELKRSRPGDAVVGQVSRYLGWVQEQRQAFGETAVGAIVAATADDKLRYAVAPHKNLTLWTYDSDLQISQILFD